MKIKLNPCPFCDSKKVSAYHYSEDKDHEIEVRTEDLEKVDHYWIRCHECDIEVHTKAMPLHKALEKWNTRKLVDTLAKRLFSLKMSSFDFHSNY